MQADSIMVIAIAATNVFGLVILSLFDLSAWASKRANNSHSWRSLDQV
jgi:hypothetical protein